MTDEEIINAINKIEGLEGMTVNERLFVSGLIDEYYEAKNNNKERAKKILEWIKVDKPSIDKNVS